MNIDNEYAIYIHAEVMEGNPTNKDNYHDLPSHLNEMLKEIADEKDKDRIIQNINSYYNSLNTLLNNHSMDHTLMPRQSVEATEYKHNSIIRSFIKCCGFRFVGKRICET